MHTQTSAHRLGSLCALVALVIGLLVPLDSASAAEDTVFELRPHCVEEELPEGFAGPTPDVNMMTRPVETSCHSYPVRDPQSRETNLLQEGEVLDMDLVIHNPTKASIKRFRTWIAMDPSLLEGQQLEISSDFPTPTPGEADFSVSDGYIKISGTATTAQTGEKIVVARIRMLVKKGMEGGIPLSFFDATSTADSRSAIFAQNGDSEVNVASQNQGYLLVRTKGEKAAVTAIDAQSSSSQTDALASSIAASVPSSAFSSDALSSSSASSIAAPVPTGDNSVFMLLQVQGVRVTTEGSSVFLAWDALPSTELSKYNIYYGTVSGRYIQRRTIDKGATTLTIRALPQKTTYYFAVRGVNESGQETEFSHEVAVSIGDPTTSTSPLSANALPTPTPVTGGTVAGSTGPTSTLLLFLGACAVIGTILAFRRQLRFATPHTE